MNEAIKLLRDIVDMLEECRDNKKHHTFLVADMTTSTYPNTCELYERAKALVRRHCE